MRFRENYVDSAYNFVVVMPNFASAHADRLEAGAEIEDWVTQGMLAPNRILYGIVCIKYKNKPGKLAAWIRTSHMEKAPKSTKPPHHQRYKYF